MRKSLRVLAVVMLTTMFTACPDSEPTAPPSGQALLKIINTSTTNRMTEIYYWKCGTSNPGVNRLVGGDTIAPNGSRIFNGISPSCYNVRTKSVSLGGAVYTAETTVDLKPNLTFELSVS